MKRGTLVIVPCFRDHKVKKTYSLGPSPSYCDSNIHKSQVNPLISGFSRGHTDGIKSCKVSLLISGLCTLLTNSSYLLLSITILWRKHLMALASTLCGTRVFWVGRTAWPKFYRPDCSVMSRVRRPRSDGHRWWLRRWWSETRKQTLNGPASQCVLKYTKTKNLKEWVWI